MSDDKKPKFEVKGAAENKPEKMEVTGNPSDMRGVIKELMAEFAPVLLAGIQAATQAGRPIDPRAERAASASGPKCPECKQLQKACKGEHAQIVVYPAKYPEFGKWFRGVGINGVWYRSDNAGQLVLVPKAAEGDIMRMVAEYEENERHTRMGGRDGSGGVAGTISPSGADVRVNPTAGWR